MTNALYVEIRDLINSGSWREAFVEKMGWGSGQNTQVITQADDKAWQGQVVARLKGFSVIKIDVQELPDHQILKNIDKALFKQFAERITIISSPTSTAWLWPRKRASGFLAPEIYQYETGRLPDYLAQKLSAISFSVKQHTKGFTLGEVRDRVRGQFDTSKVTKRFYDDFKKQHESLTQAIQGLPESEAHSYSSLLLNRLMFIYFLQKKEFINGDPNYLRNCLTKLQSLNTDEKFYSFYKHLLQVLFFSGLNKQPHEFNDPAIAQILGDPPYVNGGIFGASELEQTRDIDIPDSAFEEIFRLFDSYTWHLDTSPTGNPNEINPEVIGYIFEQYINYTANGRRESGAYYTPQDVCAYMVNSTVVPRLLEIVANLDVNLFDVAEGDPFSIIRQDLWHGWNVDNSSWEPVSAKCALLWESDPINWHELDSMPVSESHCLPGESWVQYFHRRDRVESLVTQLRSGRVGKSPEDFVTYPLDGVGLLTNYLEFTAPREILVSFWESLSKISIIDPTCGSGAFLFSALELLEDIYHSTIKGLERTFDSKTDLSHLPIIGFESSNSRYQVRKLISINNLYGTDIMADAIETAKLRLFLSLVACLESSDIIEPLPDLDFNFKVANLVVGFYDQNDAARISDDIFIQDQLDTLSEEISIYVETHASFIASTSSSHQYDIAETKIKLLELGESLRKKCNDTYLEALKPVPRDPVAWVKNQSPFHWFIEFPHILARGGFDIVIGNPPYIQMSDLPKETKDSLLGYKSLKCPDFYAICYERSLQLLNDNGRHCMIVMISLSCGSGFAPLRKQIADKKFSEWWSTYGTRPDSLFSGIEVRNTILVLGRGSNHFASAHNLFSKTTRKQLFSTLEMVPVVRDSEKVPNRGGVAADLVSKIDSSYRAPVALSGKKLFTMKSIGYWYPVLPKPTPKLDLDFKLSREKHERLQEIALRQAEDELYSLCLIGGKSSFLWWISTSNNMDNSSAYGEKILGLLREVPRSKELDTAAKQVLAVSKNHYFALKKKGYTINLRWIGFRQVTDEFESRMFKELGLEEEWRQLNIWYRQTLYGIGNEGSGIPLNWDDVDKLISDYTSMHSH
jgi:hypothetical protein